MYALMSKLVSGWIVIWANIRNFYDTSLLRVLVADSSKDVSYLMSKDFGAGDLKYAFCAIMAGNECGVKHILEGTFDIHMTIFV